MATVKPLVVKSELWITGAGPVLRRLRCDRPIGDVAKKMGITVSTLSLIERNKRRLSVDNIATFAAIIEVSPRHLFMMCLEEMLSGLDTSEKALVSFLIEKLRGQNGKAA